MRTLKILTTALTLVLFATSAAFAASYPPEVPKNFKDAPNQQICGGHTPADVYARYYYHTEEEWMVVIGGRNQKDIFIFLGLPKVGRINFFATSSGWKKETELSPQETEKLNKDLALTKEEENSLQDCRDNSKS